MSIRSRFKKMNKEDDIIADMAFLENNAFREIVSRRTFQDNNYLYDYLNEYKKSWDVVIRSSLTIDAIYVAWGSYSLYDDFSIPLAVSLGLGEILAVEMLKIMYNSRNRTKEKIRIMEEFYKSK